MTTPFTITYRLLVISFFLFATCSNVNSREFIVDTNLDAPDANPGDGVCANTLQQCTLRAAVMESNAFAGPDVIQLQALTYALDLSLAGENNAIEGDLDIRESVQILGASTETTTIQGASNGGNNDRLISVLKETGKAAPSLILKNLSLTQGKDNDTNNVAVLYNQGNLQLENIVITKAGTSSFAIFNDTGVLNIENSRFLENDSVIYSIDSLVSINNSFFESNHQQAAFHSGSIKSFHGAALHAVNSRLQINNSEFNNNSATVAGAAIYLMQSELLLESSTLSANIIDSPESEKTGFGAALYAEQSQVMLYDTNIFNNQADLAGAGIYTLNSKLSLNKSLIENNKTLRLSSSGGGLYFKTDNTQANNDSVLNINNSIITENNAHFGGGITIDIASSDTTSTSSIIKNTEISANKAVSGGGLNFVAAGSLALFNSTISHNISLENGGGIFASDDSTGNIDIYNNTIAFNLASSGGNIFNAATMRLANTIISDAIAGSDCFGSMISLNHNLDSDGSCNLTMGNDLSNSAPLLDSLKINDGETRSHALAVGSPALNAGNKEICDKSGNIDQRFHYRSTDNCDIGAYESAGSPAQSGVFELTINESTVSEPDVETIVTATIQRKENNQGPAFVTVLNALPESARLNSDYRFTTKTLEWADGDSHTEVIELNILPDEIREQTETLTLVLKQPSNSNILGENNRLDIQIIDNDLVSSKFSFAKKYYHAYENEGFVELVILRTNDQNNGELLSESEVSVEIIPKEAEYKKDFDKINGISSLSQTVFFDEAQTEAVIRINLIDDTPNTVDPKNDAPAENDAIENDLTENDSTETNPAETDTTETNPTETNSTETDPTTADSTDDEGNSTVVDAIIDNAIEGDERFFVLLKQTENTSDVTFGEITQAEVIIIDDDIDKKPEDKPKLSSISFEKSLYEFSEAHGLVRIPLYRIGDTEGEVSVSLRNINGTALMIRDYEDFLNDRLNNTPRATFKDGEDVTFVEFNIVDNNKYLANKSFLIQIFNPTTSAELGNIAELSIIIRENDLEPSRKGLVDENTTHVGSLHPGLILILLIARLFFFKKRPGLRIFS